MNYASFGIRGSLSMRHLKEQRLAATQKTVKLPPYKMVNAPLGIAIRARRSIREMSGKPMDLQTLSTILFYANGTTGDFILASETTDALPEHSLGADFVGKLRAAPSGGGLYPIYLYIVARNVKDLEDGLYIYLPLSHALHTVRTFDEQDKEAFANLAQWGVNINSAKVNLAIFFVYSLFENSRKYGDQGATFAIIEAGEMSQNMHLCCTALNLASCDIGGYEKSLSEQFLGVDGLSKHVIHLVIIGMK
ncbi:MAG: SagB/ThcOx family dehydrogenase [Chloroflexi bacterium]|nr:SagB/ThcOx family dehydrogenase [Chloroflexota bacterium]